MAERLTVDEMRQLFENYNHEERRAILRDSANGPIEFPTKYDPSYHDRAKALKVPFFSSGAWPLNIVAMAHGQNEHFINWLWYEIIRAKMDGKHVPDALYKIAKILRGDQREVGDNSVYGLSEETNFFSSDFDIKPYSDKYTKVYLVELERNGTRQATDAQLEEALLYDNPELVAELKARQKQRR